MGMRNVTGRVPAGSERMVYYFLTSFLAFFVSETKCLIKWW